MKMRTAAWCWAAVLLLELLFVATDAKFQELTDDDDFVELIEGQKSLVMFHAEWCGHCKKMSPEFTKLGIAFKNQQSVMIAKIDADKNKKIAEHYQIKGFPTVKWFPGEGGAPEDYNGARDELTLIDFINEKTGLNVRPFIDGIENHNVALPVFDAIIAEPEHDILAVVYSKDCYRCSEVLGSLPDVVKAFVGDDTFKVVTILADHYESIQDRYGSKFPVVLLYTKAKKKGIAYTDDDYSSEVLVDFINKEAGAGRNVDGSYRLDAYPSDEIKKLVTEFVKAATNTDKTAVIAKIEEAAKSVVKGRYVNLAKFYAMLMKKVVEKGSDYLQNESDRLQRLSVGRVTNEARSSALFRINILKQLKGEVEPEIETTKDEL